MHRPANRSPEMRVALAILGVVSACTTRGTPDGEVGAGDAAASPVSTRASLARAASAVPRRVSGALQAELDTAWARWFDALDRGDEATLDAARAPGARCHVPLGDQEAQHRTAARLRRMPLRCELPKVGIADGGYVYGDEEAAKNFECILGEITPSVQFVVFVRTSAGWKLDAICGGE